MKKIINVLLVTIALMMFDAKASIINDFDLPNVDNSTRSDALILWDIFDDIQGSIQSFDLMLTWKDQGFGNLKGRIFYQINDLDPVYIDIASHGWVTETFAIRDIMAPVGSALRLYYTVGGGGGHRIFISDATISITSVPEPSTLAMFGLVILGATLSRRKLKAAK